MKVFYLFTIFSTIFCATYGSEPTFYTQTFQSPAVTLYPGQIANTDGTLFDLPWLNEPMAVVRFESEVVDDDGNSVALYDLYIHHYLIYVDLGKFAAGPCGLYNTWGIGAEMRGTVYEYPYPYAIVFDGTENVTANLHFIRTDSKIGNDIHQLCIECHCWDGTLDSPHGSIGCCDDMGYCWGAPMPNDTTQAKNYYLQYTIKYTNVTDDIKPLTVSSFDVMSEENFDCSIEYQVPRESVQDGKMQVKKNTTHILQDTDIIFVEIHQHVGGVMYTVEHYRNNTYISTICESSPIYGNGTEVGNENGYVVAIPTCTFNKNSPYKVLRGDKLILTSYYDSRHINGGYPFHEGVMGLLFYWGERTGPSLCEEKLKTLCGNPLPSNIIDCETCGINNAQYLLNSDCGSNYQWQELIFLCRTDNGIKTNYPINNTLIKNKIKNEIKENEKNKIIYDNDYINNAKQSLRNAIEKRKTNLRHF